MKSSNKYSISSPSFENGGVGGVVAPSQLALSQPNTDNTENTSCGLGSCRPSCLQVFNNILSFSLIYGFTSLITQTLNIYIVSQVTALERQFDLNSTITGVILACNDIGFLCTVLFIGHFGKRSHIPRILSVAAFLFGISGIMGSLCHFLNPVSLPKAETGVAGPNSSFSFRSIDADMLCREDMPVSGGACSSESQANSDKGISWVVYLLGASLVIQGMAKAPRVPLSTAFVDNNSPNKARTSFYVGIISTMNLFGPSLSIALGGVFRKLPVDLQETSLTPRHPKWIGAWWLGFLIFGAAGIMCAVPLLFFPRRLKKAIGGKEDFITEAEVPKELSENTTKAKDQSMCEKVKDLPKSLCRVIRCPVYCLVLCGICSVIFMVAGSISFGPKYVEHQFTVPGYKTNIILGLQRLVGSTIGTFLGGLITSRLKLSRIGCLRYIIINNAIAGAINTLDFLFGCDNPVIYGYEASRPILDDGLTNCECDSSKFLPICGKDNNVYYSPCVAGCINQTRTSYGGCSAIAGGIATAGLCEPNCPYLYYYVAGDLLSGLIGTMSIMPIYMTLMRSVPDHDKSMAMALFSFLISLLGFLPAPILFGYVIDGTCTIWKSTCGRRGACQLYDLPSLRYWLKGLECGFRFIGLSFFVVAYLVARYIEKDKDDRELKINSYKKREDAHEDIFTISKL